MGSGRHETERRHRKVCTQNYVKGAAWAGDYARIVAGYAEGGEELYDHADAGGPLLWGRTTRRQGTGVKSHGAVASS